MSLDGGKFLVGFGVPDADGLIERNGHQKPAVGSKYNLLDHALVASEGSLLNAGLGVPHFDLLVP